MAEKIVLLEHDKSDWGPGPWQYEEDRIEWRHKGLPSHMVRNHQGNWCGYVGITKENPFFEKDYDKVDVEVHGGLTYSDKCGGHICHTPKPGEDGNVWWLGFDCGHAWDASPGMDAQLNKMSPGLHNSRSFHLDQTYKDVAYVTKEVNQLADQLIAGAA